MIENVVEFMAWGELDEKGKPISRKRGLEWVKWKEFINSQYGYRDDWREMNSADYGSFTARNRLFGCFAKEGLPIVFPKPTHSKKVSEGMFGGLKLWNSVREKLDFSDEGNSIFNRKKPIVDSSLGRIYAGLLKFSKEPLGAITTIDYHSLVMAENFLLRYNGGEKSLLSIEKPCPTITTKDRFAKCTVKGFVFNRAYKGSSHSLSNPCPVIIARQDKAPLYLVISESGTFNIPIYDSDSEIMVKIKQFMAANEIADIKMRMLKVEELKIIQGFPADYQLVGNKADQTKFIGNSVEPNVVKAWIESMEEQFNKKKHDTNSCFIN
jgi:DNA (cytosine-5)-methyltransferase 1